MPELTFDYVIVGAGSAGCVLANRLTEDGEASVLVLESGASDRHLYIDMPAAFVLAMSSPRFDWGFESEPEPFLHQRRIPSPRGYVLGGSSSINAMAFVRGHPADYDTWADDAYPEWSWAHCLPYFRKLETFSGGANAYRGGDGPVRVTAPGHRNVLYGAFLAACHEAGHPISRDTNGSQPEGFGPMDQTIHNGRRWGASAAYLAPARRRPALHVRTGARATRVIFEGDRATGIEFVDSHGVARVRAEREVLLCGGAFNSPHLLMLSGIGSEAELKRAGIKPHTNLPGVGSNLQDHVDFSVKYACLKPVSETPHLGPLRRILIALEWLLFKTGSGTSNHFEVAGYIKTRPDQPRPDVQLCFMPLVTAYDGTNVQTRHGFTATVMGLQPQSRGTVGLRSSDPMDKPMLRFNFLEDREDLNALVRGLECLREIFSRPAMREFCGAELLPTRKVASREEVEQFIRSTAKSTRHPCGSCRMGPDHNAVVDSEGKVHGIAGLRVVDASIMPRITSGNINAPVMMLAEKIADRIRGRSPISTADSAANRPLPAMSQEP